MSLFVNGVGRPSNEVKRKRRIAAFLAVFAIAALIGGVSCYLFSDNENELESSSKNASVSGISVGGAYTGDVASATNYATKDGKVTAEDADAIMKFSVGTNISGATRKSYADIDGNGKIEVTDARYATRLTISPKEYTLGDVNQNGKIDSKDADLILKYSVESVKPNDIQKKLADIDGDGKITATDSRLALRLSKTVSGYNLGDINKNKKYDETDANTIMKYAVGSLKPDATQKKLADIDGDGKITATDSRLVLRLVTSGKTCKLADVNCDGSITSKDAELAINYSVGKGNPSSYKLQLSDIDGDGNVTTTDSRLIQRIALGYGDVCSAPNYTKGDGKVTKDDAELILKFSVGLNTPNATQKKAADMDKDGKITSADARLALIKSGQSGLKGDVASATNYGTKDGKVTTEDADAIMKFSVGKNISGATRKSYADIDGNGKIEVTDARYATRLTTSQKEYTLGDVNKNGKIDSKDADLILKYSVGSVKPNDIQKKLADIDGDGKITATDSRLALRLSTTVSGYNLGDINKNKKYDETDANTIMKYAVGSLKPDATQKKLADIDGDGKITATDSRLVLRLVTSGKTCKLADVNCDGSITSKDAELVINYSVGKGNPNSYKLQLSDIDGDGNVTTTDSRLIQRIALGYGDVCSAPNYTKGDGKITKDDADAIMKFSVGSIKYTSAQKSAADIDGDGEITTSDARLLLRSIK